MGSGCGTGVLGYGIWSFWLIPGGSTERLCGAGKWGGGWSFLVCLALRGYGRDSLTGEVDEWMNDGS